MPGDSDIYRGQVNQRTPLNVALCAIWYRLWQITGFSNSGSGGTFVVANPATYNVSSRSQVTVNGATLLIAASGTPRKVDFINVNAIPVWISRGTTTNLAGRDYYLEKGGVYSVDEPTTDAFSACTETADNAFVNVVQRTLAP